MSTVYGVNPLRDGGGYGLEAVFIIIDNKYYEEIDFIIIFDVLSEKFLVVCPVKTAQISKNETGGKRMIKYRSHSGEGYISEDGSLEFQPKASIAGFNKDIQLGFSLLSPRKSWMLTIMETIDEKIVSRFWMYDLGSGIVVKELLSGDRPAIHINIEYIFDNGKYIFCRTTT